MPISSFYGLQTSLRGLLAQQRSLDVTGHNIANASTKGYSRQEAVLAPSDPLVIPAGATQTGSGAHLGSGVDVQQYRRIRDQFLDLQYRGQAMRAGYESTRSEQLDRVEVSLAEPGEEGIGAQLAAFWNAWNDLATAPQDNGARTALIEQGATLAEAFLTVDRQLAVVADQARQEFAGLTAPGGEVESIGRDIADLNMTIRKFVSAGDEPNDLYDRRDALLDRLSSLGQVTTEPLDDGSLRVVFGGGAAPPGVTLVDHATVSWPGGGALTTPDGKLGALKALFEPGGIVATYRAELDAVTTTLATSVNGVLSAAGAPAFFGFSAPAPPAATNPAATLAVVPAATAIVTGSSGEKGDNDLALRIAALRGADGGADQRYRAFVARVGTEVRAAHRLGENAEALSSAVDERRQSVAGVSLDEEMSNMVRFQRAYQASSRAMSTMDEMLDVLINRTGRVGL